MSSTTKPISTLREHSTATAMASFRTPQRAQLVVITLMISLSVMNLFDRTIMSIAAPAIIQKFSLSETQMGVVFSAFTFSYALFMIPGGHLADRFGPRLVLTFAALGAALFTGLTALAGKPGLGTYLGVVPAFIAIRAAFGICSAPLYPSCGRMNANWVPPQRRAFIWGLVSGGVGLGGAISPLLFGWMMARYGWRVAFWQSAAAAGALGLLWFWYVRDRPSEHPWVGAASSLIIDEAGVPLETGFHAAVWRKLLTDRNLMLLTLSYLAIGYFQYIFYFWTYYYFSTIRHMGLHAAALGTTTLFLTVMVATPIGGWISDRLSSRYGQKLGRRIVPVVALMLAPLFLYLATRLNSPLLIGSTLSLAMGFAGACEGPVWASAINIGGREVGAACGILNAGGNVGGFLGPLLTPMIAASAGWAWGVRVACLVAVAGGLIILAVDPTKTVSGLPSNSVNKLL